MAWRAALTSADGVLINWHFGHARWFYIADIEAGGSFTLAERREAPPWCQAGNPERDAADGPSSIADPIRDCRAVLTAKIGPPARRLLEAEGLAVFEGPDTIENAVKRAAAYLASS
ncbi:MAG: dinitrogenase iron-molybdenum cofactor biosynthesis protein [Treponema sp.]|jgi:nitrogen fixation protein NifB|nr:dinitrogenase iron-molybdenum cofactor biosynthesis protein [Treponema sp.]